MTDTKINTIITIAWIVVVISALLFTTCGRMNEYEKNWNDGFCSCGAEWELLDVEHTRNNSYYVYQCPKCDKIVSINSVMFE